MPPSAAAFAALGDDTLRTVLVGSVRARMHPGAEPCLRMSPKLPTRSRAAHCRSVSPRLSPPWAARSAPSRT
eukprot:13387537-Alexandrium_andersonii.AAC.1